MKEVLDFENCGSLNERDASSAILFNLPSMCTVVRGDVLLTSWRSARALRRCPARVDVEVLFFLVQDTVDILSQNIPM